MAATRAPAPSPASTAAPPDSSDHPDKRGPGQQRRLRPPLSPRTTAPALVLTGLFAAGVWALVDLRVNIATVVDGASRAGDFLSRVLPLDFPPALELLALCAQTVAIALLATVLAAALSLPLAALAAAPTTPGRGARISSRALVVVARAVPDVVLAIVFVRIFGIGALTGVLAMGLHSIGMVAKMYADAIEQADPGPARALAATGATRLQRITGAVLPQVLPAVVAVGLHRLDINLRVSVLLGFVGVGGIGLAIAESLRVLDYQRGIALALVVLALCVLLEVLSGAVRRALMGTSGTASRPPTPTSRRHGRRHTRSTTGPAAGGDHRDRSAAAVADGRVSRPWDARRVRSTVYAGVSVAVVLASLAGSGIAPAQVLGALPQIPGTLAQFWPPETGGILPTLLVALAATVKIALAATVIGTALSLPIGALAARNVTSAPHLTRAARGVILAIRGVPELILAIVLVVITGLGEVAGTIALGVGGVGLLGKLVADSLEEVDPGPATALRAAGAGHGQVFFAAILPAAAKAVVAHVLYLLDTSIRSATLLGIVGAGGIGFYLLNASRVLEFGVVTTILLLIFAAVMVVELLALWIRSRW